MCTELSLLLLLLWRIVSFHVEMRLIYMYASMQSHVAHSLQTSQKCLYIVKWKTTIKCTNRRISDFIIKIFSIFFCPYTFENSQKLLLFVSHIPLDVVIKYFYLSIEFCSAANHIHTHTHTVKRFISVNSLGFLHVCSRSNVENKIHLARTIEHSI